METLLGETINPVLRKEWETRNNEWSILDSIKLTPRNAEKTVKVLPKGTGSEHLQVKNPLEWTEEDNHWELDETKPYSDLVLENVVESESSLDEKTEEILDSEIEEYDYEQQRHNFDISKTRKKLPKEERVKGEHVNKKAQKNTKHSTSNSKSSKKYKQKNGIKHPEGKDLSPKKNSISKTKHRFINKGKTSDDRKKDDSTMDSDNHNQREDGAAKPLKVDRKMPLINPESGGKSEFEVQDDSEWTKGDSHWEYNSENPPRPDTHKDDGKDDNEGIFEHDEGHFDINILDINEAIDAYNDGDGSKSNRDGATVVTDVEGDGDSGESVSDKDRGNDKKESEISEQSENVEESEGVDNDADEDSEENTENQEGQEEEEKTKKPAIERKSHDKKKGGKIKVLIKGNEKVEDTLTVSELRVSIVSQYHSLSLF